MIMNELLDEVRDYYNESYKFLLELIEKDMTHYSWSKENCLGMLSDVIRAHMRIRNDYIDLCKSDIKSSMEGK